MHFSKENSVVKLYQEIFSNASGQQIDYHCFFFCRGNFLYPVERDNKFYTSCYSQEAQCEQTYSKVIVFKNEVSDLRL